MEYASWQNQRGGWRTGAGAASSRPLPPAIRWLRGKRPCRPSRSRRQTWRHAGHTLASWLPLAP
eukprot:4246040-Alexandrium_andersonii.AAC.1